jgi:hypothetical protein
MFALEVLGQFLWVILKSLLHWSSNGTELVFGTDFVGSHVHVHIYIYMYICIYIPVPNRDMYIYIYYIFLHITICIL